ncbi:MAG: hypothetical protein GF308_08415 [Candidatus Heimdallarchaeota archaeon]|nr:hypothetical protein [Candidatus Heimdallarchaeota archaeon]
MKSIELFFNNCLRVCLGRALIKEAKKIILLLPLFSSRSLLLVLVWELLHQVLDRLVLPLPLLR